MPAALTTAAACVLALIAIGGCAPSAQQTLANSSISSSTPEHGSLTDSEFNAAVAVAKGEADKAGATAMTSATATVGAGTETDPNAGPACTSGTLLHIKLIGTFNAVVTDLAGGAPVSAVLITADAGSGKACLISVQVGPVTPDPGATLLFTNRDDGWVTLTAGSYHGVGWTLQASMSGGKLCMQLTGPVGKDEPASGTASYSGQCQFDRACATCSYTADGPGPANSYATYGPLPMNATQVRVATNKVLPTAQLPGGHGLPSGRYWLDIHAVNSTTPSDGTLLATPQPLDAQGHTVRFQSF